MKVFISWSGKRSHAVAKLLNIWIKCVLQASRPWLSSASIERGSLWFTAINEQLKDTAVGIVCLTQENKNKPWILFESGALAKGLTTTRVCTLLVDLTPGDLDDPLAQFNHTKPDREGMLSLVSTLNKSLEGGRLDEAVLTSVFDTYWPQFEEQFKAAIETYPSDEKPQPRSQSETLDRILDGVQSLNARVRRLESSPPRSKIYDGEAQETIDLGLPPLGRKIYIETALTLLKANISEEAVRDQLKTMGANESEAARVVNYVRLVLSSSAQGQQS